MLTATVVLPVTFVHAVTMSVFCFVFPVSDCMNLFLFFVNECVFSHHNWSSGLSLSARSGTFVTAVYSKVVCIGVFLSFTCLRRVSCAVLLFIC